MANTAGVTLTSQPVAGSVEIWLFKAMGEEASKDYEVSDHNYQCPCGLTRCGWRLYLQSCCSRNQGLGVGVMLPWASPQWAVEIEMAVNLISS